MQEKEASVDPWSLFLYGMKAPMTREKYRGRLAKFFGFVGLTDNSTQWKIVPKPSLKGAGKIQTGYL